MLERSDKIPHNGFLAKVPWERISTIGEWSQQGGVGGDRGLISRCEMNLHLVERGEHVALVTFRKRGKLEKCDDTCMGRGTWR